MVAPVNELRSHRPLQTRGTRGGAPSDLLGDPLRIFTYVYGSSVTSSVSVLGGREGRPPATGLHLYLHPPPSLGFLPKVTTDDRSPAAAHTERWRSARTGYSRQGFSAHPSHRLGGRPPLPP